MMLDLKGFRSKATGLPDLLTYAALIDPGIVLQKDGSFLAAWEMRGPDTASSTPQELAYVSDQFSQAARRLGTGWMLHVDACRNTRKAYPEPERSHFPDRVSRMLDDTRRAFFGQDVCYSTSTYLTVTYLPNFHAAKMAGVAKIGVESQSAMEKGLETFKTTLLEIEDALSAVLRLTRLTEYELYDDADMPFVHSDLLAFLEYCITGRLHPLRVPHTPMYLDALLGELPLVGGLIPSFQDGAETRHLAVLSIDGLPQESWPAMFAMLDAAPFEYRYSSRYICLDQFDAEKEVTNYVKGWNQQVLGFMDQFFNNPNAKVNRDALLMREDAEIAKTEIQAGIVGAGYLSSCIVLMDTDVNALQDNARELRRQIQSNGFGLRIESINALEAWLGSLPGNGYANLRRPLVNTLNLADFLPLQSIWAGQAACPCPFYPPDSPPLAVFVTEGETIPFWFNIHVGDLGHTLIFGPTGSGKSTLLATLAWNFRRYAGARLYVFDKGMSMYPLCAGVGGDHYDVGQSLSFAPLQRIAESPSEMAWCEEWIAGLLALQKMTVQPAHRNAIHEAALLLAEQPEHMRSLTNFVHLVADMSIREALMHYTHAGAMGRLLDAETDNLGFSRFMVFEIEDLMHLGNENLIPVLLYLFHRIEKSLDGAPSWIILDEAWVMLGHPVFRAKIREWLKVLRKANCAVIMATQSLSDAKNSGIMDVLVESCQTKIYLANPFARDDEQYELYKSCGLNDRQISILARATQKRDYYMTNAYGRRLFQLRLSARELAFVGASDKESIAAIKELQREHGAGWVDRWLEQRNAL